MKNLWITPLFLVLPFCASDSPEESNVEEVQEQIIEAAGGEGDLQGYFDGWAAKPKFRQAQLSVYVCDKSGKELFAYRGEEALSPASVMKLATTTAGLGVLGAKYTYTTTLAATGKITNGVLQGDLIIQGSGDPTLGKSGSLPIFQSWLGAMQKLKITKIEGKVIADASAFSSQQVPRTWIWEDMGNYYGAGATALNFMENKCVLTFKSGKTGAVAVLTGVNPKLQGVEFISEVKAGKPGSGDNAYVFGAPYAKVRHVRGTIPPDKASFSIKASIPNPPLFVAQSFTGFLKQKGIGVSGAAEVSRMPTKGQIFVAKTVSPTLAEICKTINQKSHNLYAEAILKTIGKEKNSEASTTAGCKALKDYHASKGIDIGGMNIEDGSGLSRFNTVTSKQMATIVRLAMNDTRIAKEFRASLAVSGQSGTLRSITKGTAAQGKIIGKSGSMTRVRCYAGIAQCDSGEERYFCIILNNHDAGYSETKKMFEGAFVKLVQEY